MDFYFTNREFNLLGKAITGGGNVNQKSIYVTDDTDDEFAENAVGRSLTATLRFGDGDVQKVMAMAAQGNFVLYKDYRGRYLFMTIMEWTGFDPHNGVLSFVAENGGMDLTNETIAAYTGTKALGIADYIELFTADSGFEVGINEISNLTRTLSWDSTSDTALTRIESVATQFDAELDFRFDIDGTAIVKRYIDIYKHIGADKGQRLAVNVQLNSINTTGNIYDLYTSVVAKGDTPEGSDTPLSLAGYKWTDPDGRYVLTTQGVLMDTVANQKWSRLNAGGAIADNKGGYINRVISYTAKSQAELLQSALAGLKKAVEPVANYEADVVELPAGVQVGDTVHLVDELQGLNLSTRLLELKTSYSADTREATFGDFLIEQSQIDPAIQELADQTKNIKTAAKLAQATASTAQATATQAYSAANDAANNATAAQTAATSAQATANTAQANAAAAQTTANAAQTTATNAAQAAEKAQATANTARTFIKSATAPDTTNLPVNAVWITPATTDSNGNAVAASAKTWDGANWQDTPIESSLIADNIVGKNITGSTFGNTSGTFSIDTGGNITGAVISGSEIKSAFSKSPIDLVTSEDNLTGSGTVDIKDGTYSVEGTIDQSTSQTFQNYLGPSGIFASLSNNGDITNLASLSKGELDLYYRDGSTTYTGVIDGQIASQIDKIGTLAWSGALYPQAGDTATMSIPLSQTQKGWLIRWSYYNSSKLQNTYYNYTLLPKVAVDAKSKNMIVTLSMPSVGTFFKRLWYSDTDIAGEASNNQGTQAPHAVMDAVYAF